MKIRVYDSDGTYRGGLFKLDVFNRHTCRVWDAPPHRDYHEMLFDISNGKLHPGCWYRVQMSHHPDLTGSEECDDLMDHNSRALRFSEFEALKWFERHALMPPEDLVQRVQNMAARQGPQALPVVDPLPEAQREVWDLLQSRCLSAKQIAMHLLKHPSHEAAIRKRVQDLNRRSGYRVENKRGHGYFRPDAPPPEWQMQRGPRESA